MKWGQTIFLKAAVFLIGITVIALCVFFLPWLADYTASTFPEFSHLQYPVLTSLYVTAIPFFFALYLALKLLNYIEKNIVFSDLSVKALKQIKYCANTIGILYVVGSMLLLLNNALHPGIAIIGFTIIFVSFVIAVFVAVIEKLLKSVIDIKIENDLTV